MLSLRKLDKVSFKLSKALDKAIIECKKIKQIVDAHNENSKVSSMTRRSTAAEKNKLSSNQDTKINSDIDIIDLNRQLNSKLEIISKIREVLDIISLRKIQMTVKNYDLIDSNIKYLDKEIDIVGKLLDANVNDISNTDDNKNNQNNVNFDKNKSKKRKHGAVISNSSEVLVLSNKIEAIDPNEPVYCTCKQIAFGDMIACDNDDCPIEWFHYKCVNLSKKPKNTWMCPTCIKNKKK